MRFTPAGDKEDHLIVNFINEDTVTMKKGAPVFLKMDGNSPGLSVATSEGSAAALGSLFFGVNCSGAAKATNDKGESMVFGAFDYARVLLSTRATSTDAWASYAAIALGDIMSVNTTSGVQGFQRSGAGSATNLGWNIIAGQTLASATTLASSVGGASSSLIGNSTALMTELRLFFRAM